MGYTIASDQAVAQHLLAHPVSQTPQGVADLQAFLFTASAQLPVSAQPFQLIKAKVPLSADVVYLSGDCLVTEAVSAVLQLSETVSGQFALSVILLDAHTFPRACSQQSHVSQCWQITGSTELDPTWWVMKLSEVMERLDRPNPNGVQFKLRRNLSEEVRILFPRCVASNVHSCL